MASRHALVRRLPAVETLGLRHGHLYRQDRDADDGRHDRARAVGCRSDRLLFAAAACCDAELGRRTASGSAIPPSSRFSSRPPSGAFSAPRSSAQSARRTSARSTRRASACRSGAPTAYCMSKGAVEVAPAACVRGAEGAPRPTPRMAARGLRVLAVAVGAGTDEERPELLGLIGIADPPRRRPSRPSLLRAARGSRTVMITGDHPATAAAIARELGILGLKTSPQQSSTPAPRPRTSSRIVRGWKARGDVVAMTGDGVNDAPALREAHIGIAMGRTGTEVTREAVGHDSDRRQLRQHHRGGSRGARHLRQHPEDARLPAGAATPASSSSCSPPRSPGCRCRSCRCSLLWINIVTDGLPALALVMDPTDDDVLDRPPRRSRRIRCSEGRSGSASGVIGAAEGLGGARRVRVERCSPERLPTRAVSRSRRSSSASCFAPSRRQEHDTHLLERRGLHESAAARGRAVRPRWCRWRSTELEPDPGVLRHRWPGPGAMGARRGGGPRSP